MVVPVRVEWSNIMAARSISIQSVGVGASSFSNTTTANPNTFHGRKFSVLMVRSPSSYENKKKYQGAKVPVVGCNIIKNGNLITRAHVAANASCNAASTASVSSKTETEETGHEVLLSEALQEGLDEEMARDSRVCTMGQYVGLFGGAHNVSQLLAYKYGEVRVVDTPAAENSFTGMGIGAAMTGLRPVIEGMNMGSLLMAFNQISNNCGMLHYTSGGQFTIPVVIRGPAGVSHWSGAEHSQCLESYFQSVPGIQIVACSTPYNAKGLLKAAIRSDNPVILMEHVLLYNVKGRIPDHEYVLSLEQAEMVRPGDQVTILTYSSMRHRVMEIVHFLVDFCGYDPEVIDIRSLKPFDLHTIGISIKKTHRVLIVEECMRRGGIGASLTAAINDNFHHYLDAPIVCVSSRDVPAPYARHSKEYIVVQHHHIVTAVEQLCRTT